MASTGPDPVALDQDTSSSATASSDDAITDATDGGGPSVQTNVPGAHFSADTIAGATPLSPESRDINDYYLQHGLEFENLDDEPTSKRIDRLIRHPNCLNFVVDVGEKHSWIGSNLTGIEDAQKLKKTGPDGRPGEMGTRWIAIFSPDKQMQFVNALIDQYKISDRHKGMIMSAPGEGNLEIAEKLWHYTTVDPGERYFSIGYNTLHHVLSKKALKRARTTETVRSRHGTMTSALQAPADAIPRGLGAKITSMFRQRKAEKEIIPMTNDPHHPHPLPNGRSRTQTFSTGDHDDGASIRSRGLGETQKAIRRRYRPHLRRHTGSTAPDHLGDDERSDSGEESDFIFENSTEIADIHYHPKMLRLWHWLIICDDNTLISVHEPIPPLRDATGDHPDVKDIYGHVRRNLRTVLKCLSQNPYKGAQSRRGPRSAEKALEMGALSVRKNPTNACSLLYYYLFDDWYATWSLAVDRAHPYTQILSEIRESYPQMHHIDDLHDATQRLGSLKLVYQAYETLLARVIDQDRERSTDEPSPIRFSKDTVSKFARLKERITHLALTEITNCEQEAQGLVALTYNRLNFIETKSVEKLTLLTVALAKVTIVFLPLSLITAFFSMQVDGITNRWNANVFWASIGIALAITLIFLLFIGGVGQAVGTMKHSWRAVSRFNSTEMKRQRKDDRKQKAKARQREPGWNRKLTN